MGRQVPKFDHVPSGDLTLVITNVHGLRRRWSEGAHKPAESLLNKFIGAWSGGAGTQTPASRS